MQSTEGFSKGDRLIFILRLEVKWIGRSSAGTGEMRLLKSKMLPISTLAALCLYTGQ